MANATNSSGANLGFEDKLWAAAEKQAKVATARELWVPAVNNATTWGRWAFIEIGDPWDAKNLLRGRIENAFGGSNNEHGKR